MTIERLGKENKLERDDNEILKISLKEANEKIENLKNQLKQRHHIPPPSVATKAPLQQENLKSQSQQQQEQQSRRQNSKKRKSADNSLTTSLGLVFGLPSYN